MMKVKEIYDYLDSFAPFSSQEEWDHCGLSVGSLDADVRTVVVALDVTKSVIAFAKEKNAELVLTHHPLLFHPAGQIETGSVLYEAVASGLTFLASHTCLDKAPGGVNDCLAAAVGFANVRPTADPFLMLGYLPHEMRAAELAAHVKERLGGSVRLSDPDRLVNTVAFCSGGGGEYSPAAAANGAQALLTGEAAHHDFLAANDCGVALLAAGHYETEALVCPVLADKLRERFGFALNVFVYDGAAPVITL